MGYYFEGYNVKIFQESRNVYNVHICVDANIWCTGYFKADAILVLRQNFKEFVQNDKNGIMGINGAQ